MATHIGIGFSQHQHIETAAKDAAFNSKTNLMQDRIDFVFILYTVHYPPQRILPIIRKILNNAKAVGSSTAGIVLSESVQTKGIAILTISSDEICFGTGMIDNLSTLSITQSSSFLLKKCLTDFGQHQRSAFLLLSDSSMENLPLLVKSLEQTLGKMITIFGGGSSDDFSFKNSVQLYNDQILRHSALGVLLGGEVNIGVGGRHGWKPLGKPRFVTKSRGNRLFTIANHKATDFYNDYLNMDVLQLSKTQKEHISLLYPLGLKISDEDGYLIRNAIDFSPDGSILCLGDIPEGSEIHIMIGNKDFCREAAQQAAEEAHRNLLGKKAKLILIFDSLTRLKIFGRTAHQEIKRVQQVFGNDIPIFGMFTHGEVYPFQSGELSKIPRIQNESFVVVAIN